MSNLDKMYHVRHEMANAEMFYQAGDYVSASEHLTKVIDICPWSASHRKLRAKCRKQMQDFMGAVADMRSTTKLTSDNTQGFLELSQLLYELGQVQDALK